LIFLYCAKAFLLVVIHFNQKRKNNWIIIVSFETSIFWMFWLDQKEKKLRYTHIFLYILINEIPLASVGWMNGALIR